MAQRMTPVASARSAAARREEVWRRYGAYVRTPPLLSIEWNDGQTGARGWLVINSNRGGAAGGGTRMRAGLIRREVVYLAKTMELKFVFSGPPIGGAKAGIDFDPADPRREEVLRRWFAAVAPQLRSGFGTGGDLNVDEVLDVIPCCDGIGLRHPQEGIVRGHLQPEARGIEPVLRSLDEGVKAPVRGEHAVAGTGLAVADLVTGYGLARSIVHLYERQGRSIRGVRVAVEGFGAVGGPCALYLARAGAAIVGLSDHEKALVATDGLTAEAVEALVRGRSGKALPEDAPGIDRNREGFARVPADVFVAAAVSGTLDLPRMEALRRQGVATIACGANQPFAEVKLGSTRVQRLADEVFTVIPDVVANCGMARAFSHLMQNPGPADPAAVFRAVDHTISAAIEEIVERNRCEPVGLLAATLELALDRVAPG